MKVKKFLKKQMLLLLSLVMAAGCIAITPQDTAQAATKQKTGYVNYTYLNLRAKPTTSSKIKIRLSYKDKVIIKKTGKLWYKVVAIHKKKKYKGYVYKSYITLKKSTKKKKSNDETKVVYLTFDDGPGQYTAKLLRILDRYDAKATFFVTNQFPSYKRMIRKEAAKGHTVAVHTYSHDYATVYASTTAFFRDFNKMNTIIKNQTGHYAKLLRFPGGSSNTISRHYCSGIMSALVQKVTEKGYYYADWNVDSDDAGSARSAETVANNVISGIKTHNVSVVLQHDIKSYSVDAVETILKWGTEHGYTFKAMTKKSYMAHHGVNN